MDISFDVIWQTVLLAMAPVSEIRGSIIWGLANVTHNAANILSIYLISVVANFIPVPFILLLFRPVIRWLKRTKLFGRFAHWLERRTHRKAAAIALMIFVGIPFPTTGAWTGSMIAALLDMRFKYAIPAIILGIMISGAIMTMLVTGVLNLGALGEWLMR